jgi:kumamolisin
MTRPDTTVTLTLVFNERDRARIHDLAEVTSDPEHARYGQHLDRDALRSLVVLADDERQAVVDWLTAQGMSILPSSGANPQLMFVHATAAQVQAAFGHDLPRWIEKDPDNRGARLELAVPRRLAGYIQKVGGLVGEQGQAPVAAGPAANEAMCAPATQMPPSPTLDLGAFTPRDIRDIYHFPTDLDGAGETIALMMLGGDLSQDDLHTFWSTYDIRPPQVRIVPVGRQSPRPPNFLHALEVTMAIEWVGALAPGADIVVYYLDPSVMGDPWSAFLLQALGDDANAPTIAATSWVTPERQYYRLHGHQLVRGLLDQAAALGVTVLSASGDWGPLDGVPHGVHDGRPVYDAPWPHGTFPAVEDRVLAIGGTMITHRSPLTETGWSGPPPPAPPSPAPSSPGRGAPLPFERLASGGGFSEDVPIPLWQKPVLRGYYPRGADAPAVVPCGRGVPDVAIMACGHSVQLGPGEPLTAVGFRARCGGRWIDFAGGTSVGAPLWAAIIALLNQARRRASKSRLGFANPLLYRLRDQKPAPFRAITQGHNDVAVHVVNRQGHAVMHHVAGFECRPGWNPVTGLGVPHVTNLVEAVTR